MPANLPWQEADLTIQHPRSQWAGWGVTRTDGRALPERQHAGFAGPADGPLRAGVPRLTTISRSICSGTSH